MVKCVLDTNTLIHYQLFSEINWPLILDTDSVQLVICPTVLAELDRKKFSELDIDVRNRCRVIVNALSESRKQTTVRQGVTLQFLRNDPKVEWNNLGLDPTIPDDRIIASILDTLKGETVILVTSDLGLELKAEAQGISTRKLDESLRVKVKLDKKDEEIHKLRQHLKSLERSLPDLDLELTTDTGTAKFASFQIPVLVSNDVTELSREIELERHALNSILSSVPGANSPNFGRIDTDFRTPNADEVKRYRDDSEKYLRNLRQYREKEFHRIALNARFFCLVLEMKNSGNVPADDIDVFLHFPDGFEVLDKNPNMEPLEKPVRPAPPRSALEQIQHIGESLVGRMYGPDFGPLRSSLPQTTQNVSRLSIKRTNSFEVRIHVGRLKHKQSERLRPIWIYFAKEQDIKSFQFDYRVSAGNYPEEVTGKMSVVFS